MPSEPLRFHPEAEEEYLGSLSWYRDRSPVAAINFENAIEEAVARIGKAPKRWPIYFDSFRRYVLRQFPFSIIYQELSSEIGRTVVADEATRPLGRCRPVPTGNVLSNVPGPQLSWSGIHTSQHVHKNYEIPYGVINFHDDPALDGSSRNGMIQTKIGVPFK